MDVHNANTRKFNTTTAAVSTSACTAEMLRWVTHLHGDILLHYIYIFISPQMVDNKQYETKNKNKQK